MPGYSLRKLCDVMHGKALNALPDGVLIDSIAIDSRRIYNTEALLFFCIVGDKNNGHHYLEELIKKGVQYFVVSEIPAAALLNKAGFILVADTLKALQQLSAYHRMQRKATVIGITGSNGKTVVKEWLFSLLSADRKVIRSPKSYNSQVGVPLSVWLLEDTHEMAVFEAGISKPMEMEALEEVIHPGIGIITNIGQAHSEGFINIQQKVNEKLKLFTHAETVIYCADYPEIAEGLVKLKSVNKALQIISWGKNGDVTYKTSFLADNEVLLEGSGERLQFKLSFTDAASIENAIHCIVLMRHLGYTREEIQRGISQLTPVAMRLELKKGINNCSVINDSYNSDLVSLSIALDFLNQQQQHKNKIVILSDILQSGKPDAVLYEEVAQMLHSKQVSGFIGIGNGIISEAARFTMPFTKFFKTTGEFIKAFNPADYTNATILVKGARAFSFERISKLLEQKLHQTVMEVNLTAMVHNINYYKSKLKPGCKTMAMVKAFSYGSGSFEVANLLQFHKMDYLAVAYADEGIELRANGITLPVMVMSPQPESYGLIIEHALEPELYNFDTLQGFIKELHKHDLEKLNKDGYPVHIKLDTGMHRLGFEAADVPELLKILKNNPGLKVQSVFSHLAASDDSSFDAFTCDQIMLFDKLSSEITRQLGYPVIRHILNSSGISRFPEAQFDMVRLGIGLYGISPNIQEQQLLETVASLRTTIIQIKEVKKGESVGYNRAFIADMDKTIATVAIGYADGYRRSLGRAVGYMLVNGKFAPVVGNVCMDMCMLDITGIEANENDEVLVFGEKLPVYEIARLMNTIPYEVLTGISARVKRVYSHD